MRCPQCGRETAPDAYCGFCGARLPQAEGAPPPHAHDRLRAHAYAADPRESLYAPALISTLFPHLPPRRANLARWLLLAGVVLAVGVALARVAPIALLLGAVLLPVLYLVYFYDVAVYEDEPVIVLAGTFVAGIVLGAALSLAFYRVLIGQRALTLHGGPSGGYLALSAFVVPLLGQLLMLVGPLALYVLRPRFSDILDGLVFGVASALGFAAAQSVVYAWLIITGPLQRGGGAFDWTLPTLRVTLLTPLLYAAATGLICAALWLRRDPRVRQRPRMLATSLPFAIGAAVVGQVAPSLLTDLVSGQIWSFVWYLLAAAALLSLARISLHLGLLEKGAEADGNADLIRCPTCQRMTPDLTFCAECGVALRARPKRPARRRGASGVRPTEGSAQ
ncbi:MAG TPA: PrsW family glutamic-type intramembrane protease [Ktedonobacterales bacterium]|nr:PrsW family glutamic-type intramembrane protease [Ktedonobacterales bacterium]